MKRVAESEISLNQRIFISIFRQEIEENMEKYGQSIYFKLFWN